MERTVGAVLPRGLRLRRVQPLLDRDLACPLLYDLERGLLLGVPGELRLHLAHALEAGNPDSDLVAWLAGADLLTYDDPPPLPTDGPWQRPSTSGSLGAVWFAEDELHCHPTPGDGCAILEAVETLLTRTEQGSCCVVHLVARGSLARPQALRRVLEGALDLGRRFGRPVRLELTSDGRGLSPAMARFLAAHDVGLRLTGGSSQLVASLLHQLAGRLTLCALLDTGDRLLDLWHRATALGVRRLDATKVVDRAAEDATLGAEVRQYRRDLFTIADATYEALRAARAPRPLFEPLARVVRRQLSGRPMAVGAAGSAGYFGLLARGRLVPLLAPLAAAGDEVQPPATCPSCWGRRLCARSSDAIGEPGPLRPAPRADRCELWRAELEVGLLLYRRLERSDPAALLGLSEGRDDTPFFDPYACRAGTSLTVS